MSYNSNNYFSLEDSDNPNNNFETFDNTEQSFKYYTKYNKNIKAIRGSGVVTKRGPPDTNKSYDTIKEVLNDDIQSIPPLYPRTWDNDPQETSGYLNDLDHVDYVPDIDKYYYTAQQMDEVVLDKSIPTKSKITKKNSNQVIKLPPPLVTTKPDFEPDESEYDIPLKYKKESNKKKSLKNKTDFDSNEFGIGQSDIDRSWYDGRYLYTFNPQSLDTIYPWTNYNLLYPFGGSKDTLKYYRGSNIDKITGDPLLRKDNPEDVENFGNVNKNKKTISCIQDFNILYLSLLCLLLIIYFIKNN
jgi:hypothetical protein